MNKNVLCYQAKLSMFYNVQITYWYFVNKKLNPRVRRYCITWILIVTHPEHDHQCNGPPSPPSPLPLLRRRRRRRNGDINISENINIRIWNSIQFRRLCIVDFSYLIEYHVFSNSFEAKRLDLKFIYFICHSYYSLVITWIQEY